MKFYFLSLFTLTQIALVAQTPDTCECNPCLSTMVLTLEDSINRALTANRQILSSISSLQSTQLKLELSHSDFDLKMRPISKGGYSGGGTGGSGLDLGAGLTWEKKWSTGTKMVISPWARRLEKGTQIDLDASLIQPLFKGFNREYNLSSLRSAQFSARSALRSLHMAQTGMVLKTITALYEYIKLQKTLERQKELFEQVDNQCKIMKQKEERGLIELPDLYKVENERGQLKDTIGATESKFKENQDTIRELLALNPSQCFEVDVPVVTQNCLYDCEEAIHLALSLRTEIEQSRDEYKEKMRLSKVAKQNLKPEIDMVLRYNNTGYDRYFRDIKSRPESTWTINLSTNFDYEKVSEKISYDQSLIAADSSLTAFDQMKEKVTLEVKKAHRNLNKAIKNQKTQQSKIASFSGELKFNHRKYEKGEAKLTDIIKTEQNLVSAEVALFSAIIDQIIGEYALKSSMGLLIEKPILNS